MSAILSSHEQIRQWAEARGGYPMLEDLPDGTGNTQTLLQISFGQHALNADNNEGPDRQLGFTLVSWDDWFKELERQNLTLKVQDESAGGANEFEFVPRDGEGDSTDAAEKPPAATVTDPNWSGLR